jgi:branched-chain amino acid aminotransferase
MRDVRARGAHEAVIIDALDRVVEGTTSNIFIVRGSSLVTPPESAGILAGITRRVVLDLAPSVGLTPSEAMITRSELLAADEAFLSSSVREVVAIVRADDARIGSGIPGPRTLALHDAFRAHTRGA